MIRKIKNKLKSRTRVPRIRPKKSRKAFLYAVEGVIAAIIIFAYMGQFLAPPVQKVDWTQAALKQQSREFLTMLDNAGLSHLIRENRGDELLSIAKAFMGTARSYSLATEELFNPEIVVGVLINESDRLTVSPLVNTACPSEIENDTESGCFTYLGDIQNWTQTDWSNETTCSLWTAPGCGEGHYAEAVNLSFVGGEGDLVLNRTEAGYLPAGSLTSSIFNTGQSVIWNTARWGVIIRPDTNVTVEIRSGNSTTPPTEWSGWQEQENGGQIALPKGQYVQYRVNLSTTNANFTPTFYEITINYVIPQPSPLPGQRIFFIVDNDVNKVVDFESVFVDLNASDKIDKPAEGPFIKNQIFRLGNDSYVVSKIASDGSSVTFLNARAVRRFRDELEDFVLNGRPSHFTVLPASAEIGLTGFDAIVIPGYQNLTPLEQELSRALDKKIGIVYLANLSSLAQIDSTHREIFAVNWSGALGEGNFSFTAIDPKYDSFLLGEYFAHVPIKIDTRRYGRRVADDFIVSYWGPSPGEFYTYYIGNLSSLNSTNGFWHHGNVSSRRENFTALVMNSSGIVYDKVAFDTDCAVICDDNFTDGEPVLGVGESVNLGGNIFTVRAIDPRGDWVEILPAKGHNFTNLAPWPGVMSAHDETVIRRYSVLIDATNDSAAIVNFKPGAGRTVWMANNIASDDEWALVQAAILWASKKKADVIRERVLQRSSVSASDIFIAQEDMFQPYKVRLGVWYD